MIIQLQLSDKTYERLLASGSRLQGTIGLVSPNEGNFNEHVRHTSNGNGDYKYIRLRHGRAPQTGAARFEHRPGRDGHHAGRHPHGREPAGERLCGPRVRYRFLIFSPQITRIDTDSNRVIINNYL